MGRYPTKHKAKPDLPPPTKTDKLKAVLSDIAAVIIAPFIVTFVAISEFTETQKQKKEQRKIEQTGLQQDTTKETKQDGAPPAKKKNLTAFKESQGESLEDTLERMDVTNLASNNKFTPTPPTER